MARRAGSSVDEIAAARRNEIEPAAQRDSCRRMNEIALLGQRSGVGVKFMLERERDCPLAR